MNYDGLSEADSQMIDAFIEFNMTEEEKRYWEHQKALKLILYRGLDEAWFISAKNFLRDYIVAANSIMLLPAQQQAMALEFVERTDSFIRSRLFSVLRENAKLYKCDISGENDTQGHALLFKQLYLFTDYCYFKNRPEDNIYSNISLITTMSADNVLPTLANTAKRLEQIASCSPKDVIPLGHYYYRHINRLLSIASKGKIFFRKEDEEKRLFECELDVRNNPALYPVIARFIAENYEISNVSETVGGVRMFRSLEHPRVNLCLCFRRVPPELDYSTTTSLGNCIAIVPYSCKIYGSDYEFSAPVPPFASHEFNHKFNRVFYPEYNRNQENQGNERNES